MMNKVLNAATSGDSFSNLVNEIRVTLRNGLKKSFLSLFGFALILLLQVAFFSSEAIASPLANIKLADTSQDFAKEAGDRTKELAKNVKEGTKANIDKAKNVAKNSKDKAKNATKDLPEKAGNKVDEAIDSVKNFLGQ